MHVPSGQWPSASNHARNRQGQGGDFESKGGSSETRLMLATWQGERLKSPRHGQAFRLQRTCVEHGHEAACDPFSCHYRPGREHQRLVFEEESKSKYVVA